MIGMWGVSGLELLREAGMKGLIITQAFIVMDCVYFRPIANRATRVNSPSEEDGGRRYI